MNARVVIAVMELSLAHRVSSELGKEVSSREVMLLPLTSRVTRWVRADTSGM